MNDSSTVESRRDGIVVAIGVLTLLIGTASGNALAMVGMSVLGIVLIGGCYRGRWGAMQMLVACVAMVVAFAVAFAFTGWL